MLGDLLPPLSPAREVRPAASEGLSQGAAQLGQGGCRDVPSDPVGAGTSNLGPGCHPVWGAAQSLTSRLRRPRSRLWQGEEHPLGMQAARGGQLSPRGCRGVTNFLLRFSKSLGHVRPCLLVPGVPKVPQPWERGSHGQVKETAPRTSPHSHLSLLLLEDPACPHVQGHCPHPGQAGGGMGSPCARCPGSVSDAGAARQAGSSPRAARPGRQQRCCCSGASLPLGDFIVGQINVCPP